MSSQFRNKHARAIREASANGEIWTCKFCGKQKPAGEFSNSQLNLCLDCYAEKTRKWSKNKARTDSSKPQADTFTERNSKSTEVDAEYCLNVLTRYNGLLDSSEKITVENKSAICESVTNIVKWANGFLEFLMNDET